MNAALRSMKWWYATGFHKMVEEEGEWRERKNYC